MVCFTVVLRGYFRVGLGPRAYFGVSVGLVLAFVLGLVLGFLGVGFT